MISLQSRSRRPSSPRLEGDHGAVLVEVALITPILMFLILGLFDVAYLYRDNLTASDTAADGVKYAAIQANGVSPPPPAGTNGNADYTAVAIMRQAAANLRVDDIERIVIFKAASSAFGSPMAQVPADCKTSSMSSVSARCNIYFPAEAFRQVQEGNYAYFDCVSEGDPSCGWDPTKRENNKPLNVDYVGVYIKYKHKNITGLLGASKDIEVAKISRLEPGNFDA